MTTEQQDQLETQAHRLIRYAWHLRLHGVPGGDEAWTQWDRGAETYLEQA